MEIGLIAFAECAMQVASATLPQYRTKFSKHIFTQPQLLSILCLMRYEDWTFRETEVRLREHAELRRALELERTPDYSTVHRFFKRLREPLIAQVLAQVVAQLPVRESAQRTTVAVDSTGLLPGAISTFFVHRQRDRAPGSTWRHWLKWTVAVDVPRRAILAQVARRGPYNDCAKLRPLVSSASRQVRIGLVLADAEFDSERNHQFVHKTIRAQSIIPAKRGKRSWKIKGIRKQMRQHFPKAQYGQRALIESVFSAVKRKLSARAPGRSTRAQRKSLDGTAIRDVPQALLLGLAYDIYRL